MQSTLTYVSLFSSAGVGCFGFKQTGFDCVATNELIDRRLDVQKANRKCSNEKGYILGDITQFEVRQTLYDVINEYKSTFKIKDIDVVVATPPCQGMSVANHKKAEDEIQRNSLVVEAIKIIQEINPKFFVFENVQAFMKTSCFDEGKKLKISESIHNGLSHSYEYTSKILNFKNYGANSSRTRTLVIGVRKDLCDDISPLDLFPDYTQEKTLRELIFNFPRLSNFGDIDPKDIYHSFKPYAVNMREWIKDIGEGESAFDNKAENKRPHKIIDGKIVQNVNKNGDKYTRQYWDKVAPCIHTRNDIMASQNTVHPEDDRVFSIRELMVMMNIPAIFKWVDEDEASINELSLVQKEKFLRKNEINIRQSIGEAVPTIIMEQIAQKIKKVLTETNPKDSELIALINEKGLNRPEFMLEFVESNTNNFSVKSLSRLVELANSAQNDTAAYYTEKTTLRFIFDKLPDFESKRIKILEPSVGSGNFLPFLFKKYDTYESVELDVCDINKSSLEILKLLLMKMNIPKNFELNFICADYLTYGTAKKYDLVVGNPPFLKVNSKTYQGLFDDAEATNTAAFFLEKSLKIADNIVMIMPKYFLHNSDFSRCRELVSRYAIKSIIDFGEKGFKGVLIETICLVISTTSMVSATECYSVTHDKANIIKQNKLCDYKFPNWLLYRDETFDSIANSLHLGIFKSFRDRQLTKKNLKPQGDVWVIKSRNISRDGQSIKHIDDYDSYLDTASLDLFSTSRYYEREDVYLTPNMTYYPRVIKKPKHTVTNGSVAILELKNGIILEEKDLLYFASDEFENFYSVARNLSTRSLNIDSVSIYYFGKRKA